MRYSSRCRLQDVVVLDDERVRREIVVVLGRGLVEGLPEHEELELRREHECVAERRRAFHLPLQDPPGRHLDRRARLLVEGVAQYERGLLQPGDGADRRQVGLQRDVAVPLIPARERVTGQHIHLDVDREQVVARVDSPGAGVHVVDPVMTGHALADEPPLQVGKHDENGVYLVFEDPLLELDSGQHSAWHQVRLRGYGLGSSGVT